MGKSKLLKLLEEDDYVAINVELERIRQDLVELASVLLDMGEHGAVIDVVQAVASLNLIVGNND